MSKQTIIAFIVFLGLLALVMTTVLKPKERNLSRLAVPIVSTNEVEKIIFSTNNEQFEITKEGEVWLLDDGRLADESRVQGALESLSTLHSNDLVSSNPRRHAEYDANEEKGMRVTIFSNEKSILDFFIGMAAKTMGGTYIRLADSDDIFLLKRSTVATHFVTEREQWKDLAVFDIELSDVAALKVETSAGRNVDIVAGENKQWVLGDPSVLPEEFRLDSSRIEEYVSAFLTLRAADVLAMSPDPSTSGLGFDNARDTYTLTLKNSETYTLRLGNLYSDGKSYYAEVNGEKFILITTIASNAFQVPLTHFRSLTLMDFDPEEVTQFSITSKLDQWTFKNDDGKWVQVEDKASSMKGLQVSSHAVEEMLQALSTMTGSTYVENVESSVELGFNRPTLEIRVTFESNKTATLLVGGKNDKDLFYVRGNADAGTYLVQERKVKAFTKRVSAPVDPSVEKDSTL